MAKSRLYVSNHVADHVVAEIDKRKFLGLGPIGSTPRIELYAFAFALGIAEGGRPSNLKGGKDFIQMSSARGKYESILIGTYLSSLIDTGDIEPVTDTDAMINHSDAYANEGFRILEEKLNTSPSSREDTIWQELGLLNEKYDSIEPLINQATGKDN